jgi:hypothetical protein
MNRSIALCGIVLIALGLALIAYPIATTGSEGLDLELEMGLLVAPLGLVIVMLGALAPDPSRTTVGGTFGNPDTAFERAAGRVPALEPRALRVFNPHEPVNCRYCRTVIAADLAICPRCARPRECRSCGRPLGVVNDHVTCPGCSRSEALCNCPSLARAPPPTRPTVPAYRRPQRP